MSGGRMTKCHDCGTRMKVHKSVVRPLCRKCRKRHVPIRKTYAIIKGYERVDHERNYSG